MVSTYLRQSRALENWIFNTLSVRAHIWNTTYTHLHQWISLIQLHCSTSWTGYPDYGSLSPAGCLDPPEEGEVPYSLSQFNLTQRPLFFLHLHLSPSLMDIIREGTVHDDYTMSSYNLYIYTRQILVFLVPQINLSSRRAADHQFRVCLREWDRYEIKISVVTKKWIDNPRRDVRAIQKDKYDLRKKQTKGGRKTG